MAIDLNTFLVTISGIAFIVYGISLFISKKMKDEFIRFNLEKYTNLVGGLELLGGLGLLIGLIYNELLILSSMGLSLLMFMGVITRIKIKDNLKQSLPAILFLLLNSYIFLNSLF
jgi:uncharacterized membrane protein